MRRLLGLLALALALPAGAQLLPPLPGGSLVVSMSAPPNGATVSGTVSVAASVSIVGTLTVSRVEFYADGAFIGADGAAPYAVAWDTRKVANGSHTLRAVAQDALGVRWSSSSITVTASNGPPPDTTPPSVSITSPANGATVSGTITVAADASDSVGVASVQFRLNGADAGPADTSAPYSIAWDTRTVPDGAHAISAVARDAAGNSAAAAPVSVTVSNAPPADTTPPSVSITSPAGGATVSGTITVSAHAADDVGVTVVEFLLDGVVLAGDAGSPYEATWDTTFAADGEHALSARARDAAGNEATSAPVRVMVANAAATAARFEEDHPAVSVAPADAWRRVGAEVAAFSGGTAGASNAAGASLTFSFNGTSVTWLGLKCDACGIATVQIDGGAPVRVDTAGPAAPGAPGLASQTVFSAAGLAPGDHTLALRVTGETSTGNAYVIMDAFDVAGGTGASALRIEETGAGTSATGAWALRGAETAAFSGGQAGSSDAAGATFTLDFTGTAVSWIGLRCSACGIATVALDGGAAMAVDTAGPAAPGAPGLASETVFGATGLAAGSHRLAITVTGTTSSGGAHVIVDAFDVTP